MTNFSIFAELAADPNVDPMFRTLAARCIADQKNLLVRRAAVAKARQYSAEPESITGFDSLPQTQAERAADDYQDRRILQDKEDRHFGSES